MPKLLRYSLLWLCCIVFVACSSSRYRLQQDVAPEGDFDFSQVPDAQPVWEPISPGGNKSPYTVRGLQYQILPTAKGYVEEGISSWYGLKFHGELTSNGELYNMYEMSAAHKTLPIPSYVKVTNLENNKTVVVRVNDRGPFHEGRIIDLSFAAANRLGFAGKGTVQVRLEAITPTEQRAHDKSPLTQESSKAASLTTIKKKPEVDLPEDRLAPFVQVAAFSKQSAAEKAKQRLEGIVDGYEVFVASSSQQSPRVYRVRIGPFATEQQALQVRKRIESAKIGSPIVITRSIRAKGS